MGKQADMARRAGASQSLVNKILDGRHDVRVTDRVRQQVLRVATDMNYRVLRSR